MTCFFHGFEHLFHFSRELFSIPCVCNANKTLPLFSLTTVSERHCRLLLVLISAFIPLQTLKAGMASVPPEVSPWQYDVKVNCVSLPTPSHFNQPPETTGVYNYQSCSSGGSFLSGESCVVDDAIEIMHLSGPGCPRPVAEVMGDWISPGSSATFCGSPFSPRMSLGLEYVNLKPYVISFL